MRIRKRSLLPFITFNPVHPRSDLLPHKNPSRKEQETIEGGAKTAVEDPTAKADEGDEAKGLHPDEDLKQVQSSRDFTCQSSLRRPKALPSRSPSDLQLTIFKRKNQWILSDDKEERTANPNQMKALQGEDEDGDVGYKTNRRNGNSSGAETAAKLPFPSSSSPPHVLVRRCDEGERAFPLKKRRGSLGYGGGGGGMIVEKERKMKSKPKIKRPKKLNDNDDDYEDEEEEDTDDEKIDGGVRKRGRGSNGGALMEGSRCSRVNGRGWRCCQQTLVGYSLCEHHLGKGRLRSMSSVRSRSFAATRPTSHGSDNLALLSSSALKGTPEEMNVDEEDTTTMKKKRKKIGMVKARSISSLLDQTHHIQTITPVNSAATGDVLV